MRERGELTVVVRAKSRGMISEKFMVVEFVIKGVLGVAHGASRTNFSSHFEKVVLPSMMNKENIRYVASILVLIHGYAFVLHTLSSIVVDHRKVAQSLVLELRKKAPCKKTVVICSLHQFFLESFGGFLAIILLF